MPRPVEEAAFVKLEQLLGVPPPAVADTLLQPLLLPEKGLERTVTLAVLVTETLLESEGNGEAVDSRTLTLGVPVVLAKNEGGPVLLAKGREGVAVAAALALPLTNCTVGVAVTAAEPLGSCEPLPVPQAHCVAEDVALPVAAPLLDMVELPVALPVALPVGAVEKVPIVLGDGGIDPVPATLLNEERGLDVGVLHAEPDGMGLMILPTTVGESAGEADAEPIRLKELFIVAVPPPCPSEPKRPLHLGRQWQRRYWSSLRWTRASQWAPQMPMADQSQNRLLKV